MKAIDEASVIFCQETLPAPSDGAVWVIEDDDPGRLLRLTPAK